MSPEDTIVAISTPPGRGGIGVVRISGARAVEILHALIRLPEIADRRAMLGEFIDTRTGKMLDRVIATCFRAPHSYTGEDVVEISCHGSPVILGYLASCCAEKGARPAEPGEFTLRAFLNRRIDLAQAEAIRDLIDSRTLFQARIAAQQAEGAVSKRLKPHKTGLVNLIARLEAGIDFADDDISVSSWEEIVSAVTELEAALGKLAAGFAYGKIIRAGLSLAIAGRPNVGKSSLFNRLLDEERAIVTEIPGTTRDLVAETGVISGIPVRLVDTAGIRETTDRVEKIGVERSLEAAADANLRLLVVDGSEGWTDEDAALLARIRGFGPLLVACNKSDLPARITPAAIQSLIGGASPEEHDRIEMVATSALTGAGVDDLREAIVYQVAPSGGLDSEDGVLTDLRHQQAVNESIGALRKASEAAAAHIPHEMLLLDLYDALRALDTITGETTNDNILGVIFSTFCVGK